MVREESKVAKLKLGPIVDEKPVRLTAELPASVHRDLLAYAEVLGQETGQAVGPAQLVAPMLARFMETDRGFAKMRNSRVGVGLKPRGRSPDVPRNDGEMRSEIA